MKKYDIKNWEKLKNTFCIKSIQVIMSEVETKKDTENATQVANDEPLNRVNGKLFFSFAG